MNVFFRRTRCALGYIAALSALIVSPAAANEPYALSSGDTVQVLVIPGLDEPVSLRIDNEGRIIMPLVGAIELAGRTTQEAEQIVSDLLTERQVFADPTVAVSLSEARPIYVTGDVANPGAFPGQLGLRVDQALALAGGTRAEARTELSAGAIAGLQADLVSVVAQVEALEIRQARYRAEADGTEFASRRAGGSATAGAAFISRMRALEEQDYRISLEEFERRLQELSDTLVILAKEKQAIVDQTEALSRIVELFNEEMERVADLVARDLITRAQSVANERNLVSARAELFDQRRRFAELEAAELRLQNEIQEVAAARKQQAYEILSQLELQRVELVAERDAITSRLGYSSAVGGIGGPDAALLEAEGSIEAEVTRVRQLPSGDRVSEVVKNDAQVMPGDLLLVRILPNFNLLQ